MLAVAEYCLDMAHPDSRWRHRNRDTSAQHLPEVGSIHYQTAARPSGLRRVWAMRPLMQDKSTSRLSVS